MQTVHAPHRVLPLEAHEATGDNGGGSGGSGGRFAGSCHTVAQCLGSGFLLTATTLFGTRFAGSLALLASLNLRHFPSQAFVSLRGNFTLKAFLELSQLAAHLFRALLLCLCLADGTNRVFNQRI